MTDKMSPLKAIRKKCLECQKHHKRAVLNCNQPQCVLWPYRLGRDPGRIGVGRKGGNPSLRKG